MDLLGSLLGALGSLAGAIEQALIYLFNLIVEVFEFIWGAIQIIGGFLLTALKSVGNFFSHIWTGFFKKIFTDLFKGLRTVHDWIEARLAPIIKFLKTAQKFWDKIYKQYVRPFLKVLQITRKYLELLKALGFKWAGQLDTVLGHIQADVQKAVLEIRGVLTNMIDLLNIISDPEKLLRRPTLALSFMRVLHSLIREITGLPPAFFIPSRHKGAGLGFGFLSADFNPANPLQNPPASYYMGFDYGVPSLELMDPTLPVPDDTVDQAQGVDFFLDANNIPSDCDDPETCLAQAARVWSGGV